jgi:hypothetical protein
MTITNGGNDHIDDMKPISREEEREFRKTIPLTLEAIRMAALLARTNDQQQWAQLWLLGTRQALTPNEIASETRRAFPEAELHKGSLCPYVNFYGFITHTSSKRRVFWQVDRNGDADVEIRRPDNASSKGKTVIWCRIEEGTFIVKFTQHPKIQQLLSLTLPDEVFAEYYSSKQHISLGDWAILSSEMTYIEGTTVPVKVSNEDICKAFPTQADRYSHYSAVVLNKYGQIVFRFTDINGEFLYAPVNAQGKVQCHHHLVSRSEKDPQHPKNRYHSEDSALPHDEM